MVLFLRRILVLVLILMNATDVCCFQVMGVITFWDEKNEVIENCMWIIHRLLMLVCIIVAFTQPRRLNALITRLEHLGRDLIISNEQLQKEIKTTFKMSKLITQSLYFIFWPVTTIMIAGICGFYCYPHRRLWTKNWYPYDVTKSPAFEISLTLFLIEMSLMTGVVVTLISSMLFGLNMIFVSFRVICYNAHNIRQNCVANHLKCQSATLQVISMVQESSSNIDRIEEDLISVKIQDYRNQSVFIIEEAHGGSNTYIYCGEGTSQDGVGPSNMSPLFVHEDNMTVSDQHCTDRSLYTRLTPFHGISLGNNRTSLSSLNLRLAGDSVSNNCLEDLAKKLKKTLKEIVGHHTDLLWSVGVVNVYLKYAYMGMVIANYVTFSLTLMTFQMDISTIKKMYGSAGSILMIMTFFGMNIAGNKITDEAAAVAEAVYSSDWLEASPSLKKSMMIVMLMANSPVQLKTSGFDPFSLKLFGEVCNIAYKMTTTVSNFFNMDS